MNVSLDSDLPLIGVASPQTRTVSDVFMPEWKLIKLKFRAIGIAIREGGSSFDLIYELELFCYNGLSNNPMRRFI